MSNLRTPYQLPWSTKKSFSLPYRFSSNSICSIQLHLNGIKTNSWFLPHKLYCNMMSSTRYLTQNICTGRSEFQTRRWSTCSPTHSVLACTHSRNHQLKSPVSSPPTYSKHSINRLRSNPTNTDWPCSGHHRRIHFRLPDRRLHHPWVPRQRYRKMADGVYQRDARLVAGPQGCHFVHRRPWWRACNEVLWESVWHEEVCSWDGRPGDHVKEGTGECLWWHMSGAQLLQLGSVETTKCKKTGRCTRSLSQVPPWRVVWLHVTRPLTPPRHGSVINAYLMIPHPHEPFFT